MVVFYAYVSLAEGNPHYHPIVTDYTLMMVGYVSAAKSL